MKICIGITSYLPDDSDSRQVRIDRLKKLLKQLNNHFKLPIIIVAQNWKEFKVEQGNIAVFNYNKLGITGARIILRKHFLNSVYDYMIMLDDDMELSEDQSEYDNYISTIESTKKEYYYVKNYLNNFSCISRIGFDRVNYDLSVDPEQGTGYEDWVFNEKCKKLLDSMDMKTNLPAYDRSHFLDDQYSTWNKGNSSLTKSNEISSISIIKRIRGGGDKFDPTDSRFF